MERAHLLLQHGGLIDKVRKLRALLAKVRWDTLLLLAQLVSQCIEFCEEVTLSIFATTTRRDETQGEAAAPASKSASSTSSGTPYVRDMLSCTSFACSIKSSMS